MRRPRLLLVTPETPAIRRFRRRQLNNFPQLTMPYLAGFVDEARFEVTLSDEYDAPIFPRAACDLVAMTVNTPNALHCYRMAAAFRAQGAEVVFGGPHATLLPEEAAAHCDYLIEGEAEATWPRFLEDYLRREARPRYRCASPPSLSGLPHPRLDLIPRRRLARGATFATRGCPYSCRYCNLKQIYGPGFRTRPVAEVVAEIARLPDRHFVFWDDNLFGDVAYAKQLLRALRPLRRRWAAQVTADRCADDELLQLAQASGCVYLFVGLESFSAASLASVNKSINAVEGYGSLVRSLHRHGISVQAGIVFGLEEDRPEVFREALAACEALGIDGVTVSVLSPLPRTPVYESLRREGRLLTDDWSSFDGKTSVAFAPRHMSAQTLFEGTTWFRRELYSLRSIAVRLARSRTNLRHGLLVNLGYKLSLGGGRR